MGCQRPLGKKDYTERGGERISEEQNYIKGVAEVLREWMGGSH